MLTSQNYRLDDDARTAMEQYITARRTLPHSPIPGRFETRWTAFTCARPTA
jgi:hypothetical protein